MKAILFLISLFACSTVTAQDNPATPVIKWKFTVQDAIISSPVIDDDVVYFSSLDKNLYAVDLLSGKPLWKFETTAPNRSTVMIADQSLFFVSGDGKFYCLNKKTAAVKWTFKTKGEKKYNLFSFADHFQSSAVTDGNTVYFGSGDNNIYAVNIKNGKLVWKYETRNVVHATPVIHNDNILAGSFDGFFYSLHKNTGKLIWKFKSAGQRYFPAGEFSGFPCVNGNTVYVGSRDFNLYALDINKGVSNWNRYFTLGWSISKPSFYKNMVINGTSDNRILVAMDTANGSIKWKTKPLFNIFGSCLISDSTGFFGTLSGRLYSVNPNNGNILWEFATEGHHKNYYQYFTKDDQYNSYSISLLQKDLAEQVSIFYKVGGIFSQPSKKDNLLVVTSSEGIVYCLIIG